MTIYDVLRDIFQNKTATLIDDHEFKDAYASNYLMQRWVSMDSPDNTLKVNETTNKLWKGLEDDKDLWYKLFIALTEKKRFTKISYIKKQKKIVNEKRNNLINMLSNRNEISKRETEENLNLLEMLGKDTKKFKKLVK